MTGVRARVAEFRTPSWRRALLELAMTIVPFAFGLLAMLGTLDHSRWLTLALALPVGLLLLRLFVIQHDCGHGSFFATRAANDLVGGLLGVFTLAPYGYWRRNHAHHHAHHGNLDREQLGGLETLTVARYRALSPVRKLAYRLYRQPLILLGLGPIYQFGVKHRLPFDIPLDWRREWLSVIVNNLVLLGGFGFGVHSLGLARTLEVLAWILGPVWMVMAALGIWLFYVQHQFVAAYWRPAGEWSFVDSALRGSSFYDLPAPLRWLTGNIGYHHIHHLAPKIPMYRLAECHAAFPELAAAPRLGLRESLACARLRLWDEQRQRLVGLADLSR